MALLLGNDHRPGRALRLADLQRQLEFIAGACSQHRLYEQLKELSGRKGTPPLVVFKKVQALPKRTPRRPASMFPVAEDMIRRERGGNGGAETYLAYNDSLSIGFLKQVRDGVAHQFGLDGWATMVAYLAGEQVPQALKTLYHNLCSPTNLEGKAVSNAERTRQTARKPIRQIQTYVSGKPQEQVMAGVVGYLGPGRGKDKPTARAVSAAGLTSCRVDRTDDTLRDGSADRGGRPRPMIPRRRPDSMHRRTVAMLRRHGVSQELSFIQKIR